jgi:DNA-binding transcriptional ArsR family regulator
VGLATLLVLAVQVAAPVSAATQPVTGTLEAAGPATLLGENSFVAEVDGALYQGTGGGSFRLDAAGARATYVNVPRMVFVTPGIVGDGDLVPLQEEVLGSADVAGLTFSASGPDTEVRFQGDGGPIELDLAATPTLRAGPGAGSPAGPPLHGVQTVQGHVAPLPPAGWLDGFTMPSVAWGQPFVAFLMGGTVRSSPTGPDWPTGHWVNQTRSHVDPATGSGVIVFDNRIVLVEGRGGLLQWTDDGAGWTMAAAALHGQLHGDVAWTGVEADLTAGGNPLSVDPRLLHMRGDLELGARFDGSSQWRVDGEAHFIAVDGGPDLTAVGAAAAAAGVGLLAALASLFTEPGRALLAFLLGRHGRLRKAAPLRSPSRRRVLEAIHVHQPVRVTELRTATGLSRTSLAYHLRVLLAYNVVQEAAGTAGGRNACFVLNSGSLDFAIAVPPAAPQSEARAMEALAVANSHPVRRSLYEAVRDHGPTDFAGMNAARRQAGLPAFAQSSATHHLQQLLAAGALVATRDGKRKVYAVALRDDEARVEQYRRFLRQMAALDLVRSLLRHPVPRDAAGSDLATLRRLCDLGLVAYDASARTFRVADLLQPVAVRL